MIAAVRVRLVSPAISAVRAAVHIHGIAMAVGLVLMDQAIISLAVLGLVPRAAEIVEEIVCDRRHGAGIEVGRCDV
jgi:hypothetical protein